MNFSAYCGKKLLCILVGILLLLALPATALKVTPVESWLYGRDSKCDSYAHFLGLDMDDNIYVGGYTEDEQVSPSIDYTTIKYSEDGAFLWDAHHEWPGNTEYMEAFAVSPDGYTVGTGRTGEYGAYDAPTSCWDPAGNKIWSALYDTGGSEQAYAVVFDDIGNVYVGTWTPVGGDYTPTVIKYAPTGDEEWIYLHNEDNDTYNANFDLRFDGQDIVLATNYGSYPNYDIFLVKLTTDGTELWNRTYAGPAGYNDSVSAITIDVDANILLTGYEAADSSDDMMLTAKYAPDGTLLWAQTKFNDFYKDIGKAITVDDAGNAYVTGVVRNDPVVKKYFADGTEGWSTEIPFDSNLIALGPDGYVYVGGEGEVEGDQAKTFVRITADGQIEREVIYHNAHWGDSYAYALEVDSQDRVVMAGRLHGGYAKYETVRFRFCDGCRIDLVEYCAGDRNPANTCEVCDPAILSDDWSALADGEACEDGLWCNGTDTCLSRSCSNHADPPCDTETLVCNESSQTCSLAPPQMNVTPTALTETLLTGQSASQELHVANTAPEASSFLAFSVDWDGDTTEAIVGGMDALAADNYRTVGNMYDCTTDARLTAVRMYLDVPEDMTLYGLVYEQRFSNTFYKIEEKTVSITAAGEGWYTIDGLDVQLLSGNRYIIAACWGDTQVTTFSGTSTNDTVPFGTRRAPMDTGYYRANKVYISAISNPQGIRQEPVIASPASWLTVSPVTGMVAPQNDTSLSVTIDATGLVAGSYDATIRVSGDDPDRPLQIVPVTLEIPGACTDCEIDGVCRAHSSTNPDNSCQICDTSQSTTAWTQLADSTSCDDGLFCNGTDTCNTGICDVHTGNPCGSPSETCDEWLSACVSSDPDIDVTPQGLSVRLRAGTQATNPLDIANVATAGSADLSFTTDALQTVSDVVGAYEFLHYENQNLTQGNLYNCDTEATLTGFRTSVHVTEAMPLLAVVYEEDPDSGLLWLVYQEAITLPAHTEGWLEVNGLSISLTPGNRYFLGLTYETLGIVLETGYVSDQALSWGTCEGGQREYYYNGNPLAPSAGSSTYRQEVFTEQDADWLTVTPANGSVTANGSQAVSIGVDAASLANGIHPAFVRVSSNDPDEPLMDIPVTTEVYDGCQTCAIAVTPASITKIVPPGSTLDVPITIQNTGTDGPGDLDYWIRWENSDPDEVGGTNYTYSIYATNGNTYEVTQDTVVNGVSMYLDVPGNSEAAVIVYVADALYGPYTHVETARKVLRGNDEGWYLIDGLHIPMEAGHFYAITFSIEEDADFYRGYNAALADVSFGELRGYAAHQAFLPAAPSTIGTNYHYRQRVYTDRALEWASLSETSGTLGTGESDLLTLTLDSTAITQGSRSANLWVENTDPNHPRIVVPVTMASECDGCLIGGFCYADGDTRPTNECLICDPAVSSTGWTDNNGAICDSGYCTTGTTCAGGSCTGGTARDCDDGVFCNGVETCDEQADECVSPGDPCDGWWSTCHEEHGGECSYYPLDDWEYTPAEINEYIPQDTIVDVPLTITYDDNPDGQMLRYTLSTTGSGEIDSFAGWITYPESFNHSTAGNLYHADKSTFLRSIGMQLALFEPTEVTAIMYERWHPSASFALVESISTTLPANGYAMYEIDGFFEPIKAKCDYVFVFSWNSNGVTVYGDNVSDDTVSFGERTGMAFTSTYFPTQINPSTSQWGFRQKIVTQASADWISLSSSSGELLPGEQKTVTVSLDAASASQSIEYADLWLNTNDPVRQHNEIDVRMVIGPPCTGCVIDGRCYPDGTINSANECETCDLSASADSWTPREGESCDDGRFCNGPGTCDSGGTCVQAGTPCQSGECCDENTDTCQTMDISFTLPIAGASYPAGDDIVIEWEGTASCGNIYQASLQFQLGADLKAASIDEYFPPTGSIAWSSPLFDWDNVQVRLRTRDVRGVMYNFYSEPFNLEVVREPLISCEAGIGTEIEWAGPTADVWTLDGDFDPAFSGATSTPAVVSPWTDPDATGTPLRFYRLKNAGTEAASLHDLGRAEVPVRTGYNLLAVPFVSDPAPMASDVVTMINDQGGMALTISKWDAFTQAWRIYDPTFPIDDFTLAPGEGFFLQAATNSTWTTCGIVPRMQTVPIQLVTGYSMPAAPTWQYALSSDLVGSMIDAGLDVTELLSWDTSLGSWLVYDPSFPLTDFAIRPEDGYFAKAAENAVFDLAPFVPRIGFSYLPDLRVSIQFDTDIPGSALLVWGTDPENLDHGVVNAYNVLNDDTSHLFLQANMTSGETVYYTIYFMGYEINDSGQPFSFVVE